MAARFIEPFRSCQPLRAYVWNLRDVRGAEQAREGRWNVRACCLWRMKGILQTWVHPMINSTANLSTITVYIPVSHKDTIHLFLFPLAQYNTEEPRLQTFLYWGASHEIAHFKMGPWRKMKNDHLYSPEKIWPTSKGISAVVKGFEHRSIFFWVWKCQIHPSVTNDQSRLWYSEHICQSWTEKMELKHREKTTVYSSVYSIHINFTIWQMSDIFPRESKGSRLSVVRSHFRHIPHKHTV